jgi:hypothetical protein
VTKAAGRLSCISSFLGQYLTFFWS